MRCCCGPKWPGLWKRSKRRCEAMEATWDWPESAWKRKKDTVGQRIYWSYSWLIATRIAQEMNLPPGKRERNKKAVPIFGKLDRGELTISSLESDYFQAMIASAMCAHCGASSKLTKDHLIPCSRGGREISENIVLACQACNSRRRDVDLMCWYRADRRFPTLVLLRHYLKICRNVSVEMQLFDTPVEQARADGLPFDPTALPEKFPELEMLRYRWE